MEEKNDIGMKLIIMVGCILIAAVPLWITMNYKPPTSIYGQQEIAVGYIGRMFESTPCDVTVMNKTIKSLSIEKNIDGQYHYEEHGSVSGSFILGFGRVSGSSHAEGDGYIKNVMMYYYYGVNPDGGYKLESVSADDTTIYEDANETSYIEWTVVNDTRQQIDRLYVGDDISQEQITQTYCKPMQNYQVTFANNRTVKSGEYYLHIPNGSIKTEYNPNLEGD